jgi:hypothetical protein
MMDDLDDIAIRMELDSVMEQFQDKEGVIHILNAYLRLHDGKIGAHWLWAVIERVANGESAREVLRDYGYRDDRA